MKQNVAAKEVDVALLRTIRGICNINYTYNWLRSCIKHVFVVNTFEVDVSILCVNCYKLFRSLPEDIWKLSIYLPLWAYYMDNLQCIHP